MSVKLTAANMQNAILCMIGELELEHDHGSGIGIIAKVKNCSECQSAILRTADFFAWVLDAIPEEKIDYATTT